VYLEHDVDRFDDAAAYFPLAMLDHSGDAKNLTVSELHDQWDQSQLYIDLLLGTQVKQYHIK
jgi:hypothetical protein